MIHPKTKLEGYTDTNLSLIGKEMHFDIPWNRVLMLSQVQGDHFVCLVDGHTGFEVSHDDFQRIQAAFHVKQAGNPLKEFSQKDTLQCPEI